MDTKFLDSKHAIYASHEQEWYREERRHEGGDAVLSELIQFEDEDTTSLEARKAWARWRPYGRGHTTVLSGHLISKMPVPNYGDLGEVRDVGDTDGKQSLAEIFHYNCDGIGNDGAQLPAFLDGVEQNAMATRFRWLMCELPTKEQLRDLRVRMGTREAGAKVEDVGTVTDEEVRSGFRPFWVEYSPLSVTNWRIRLGVLIWAIVRVTVEDKEGTESDGYYVLVRGGYRAPSAVTDAPGADFNGGGWWKFDAEKRLIDQGDWRDTDGQIPMWLHVGKPGKGTYQRPSIGQSLTMELGQISADVMNAVSEQRYNLRQAAKSVNYWIGMFKPAHDKLISQATGGSIHVAVEPSQMPDGTWIPPTLANSAGVLLDSEAFQVAIEGADAEAKAVMVRQIMAAPDASGARVEAEHASATAPLLAELAGTFETSVNTGLYFTLRRFGLTHEQASEASVAMPREFQLRDVVDDIDKLLDTMDKAKVVSPTWLRSLVVKKGAEMDLMPDTDREQIEDELEGAATVAGLAVLKSKAEAMTALIGAGAMEEAAAGLVGFTPAEARALFGDASGADDEEDDEEREPPVRIA